jgi:hypothetical protein
MGKGACHTPEKFPRLSLSLEISGNMMFLSNIQ